MRLVTLSTGIRLFFLSVYLLSVQTISAQSVREYLRGHVDSMLQAEYNKVTYDPNFISRDSLILPHSPNRIFNGVLRAHDWQVSPIRGEE